MNAQETRALLAHWVSFSRIQPGGEAHFCAKSTRPCARRAPSPKESGRRFEISRVATPHVRLLGRVFSWVAIGIFAFLPKGTNATTSIAPPIVENFQSSLPSQRILNYPWPVVWRAAVRLLRVDRGFQIDDRDEEAGYIIFHGEADDGPPLRGSIELIADNEAASRGGVKVQARVYQGGAHSAFTLLDQLSHKLRVEHGPPQATSPSPSPPTTPEPGAP